ncbi:MAG: hypothetical protein HYZ72_18860 [Deltaproteobacteria bacterium]|nr:hypothetical protein [Deltaproteobacteria bacterium]
MKKVCHFLCGLICGAAGMHWYAVSAEETLDQVSAWLQNAADEYRASHPTPEVDTGWRPRKRENH